MLSPESLPFLRDGKNLLAFSGGSDSTALFFLLHDAGIAFDIALVNYHTRPQSDDEARYAQTLSKRYGQHCFLHDAPLHTGNFEHEARSVRYDFFEGLIEEKGYSTLLTAHQLDDRLEWFLMQLCKGAGAVEMSGMKAVEERNGYTLLRPLLQSTKAELRRYLERRGESWFEDVSNADVRHRRNAFRHRFAAPMLQEYASGIRKSFAYLDEDIAALDMQMPTERIERLWWFETPAQRRVLVNTVDRLLKREGFLMRQGDKERLKRESSLVIGRRFAVAAGERYTFIAPYETAAMSKVFRERCRLLGIDPKLRPYLSHVPEAFEKIALLLGDTVHFHRE